MVYVNGGLRRGGEILHTGEAASTPPGEGKGDCLPVYIHLSARCVCIMLKRIAPLAEKKLREQSARRAFRRILEYLHIAKHEKTVLGARYRNIQHTGAAIHKSAIGIFTVNGRKK